MPRATRCSARIGFERWIESATITLVGGQVLNSAL
jgi:hypothetical protein